MADAQLHGGVQKSRLRGFRRGKSMTFNAHGILNTRFVHRPKSSLGTLR